MLGWFLFAICMVVEWWSLIHLFSNPQTWGQLILYTVAGFGSLFAAFVCTIYFNL